MELLPEGPLLVGFMRGLFRVRPLLGNFRVSVGLL